MRALNARNAWTRTTTRHLFQHPPAVHADVNDIMRFHSLAQHFDFTVLLPGDPCRRGVEEHTHLVRVYTGGDVVLVSDGSAPRHALGWGALVADSEGPLATQYAGVSCDISYSWAAEWLGKLAAVRLAVAIGIPPSRWAWSIADNLSTAPGLRLNVVRFTPLGVLYFPPFTHRSPLPCLMARNVSPKRNKFGSFRQFELQVRQPPSLGQRRHRHLWRASRRAPLGLHGLTASAWSSHG